MNSDGVHGSPPTGRPAAERGGDPARGRLPLARVAQRDTHRLIPSRFPPVGILDTIAAPEDLALVIELEGWTNDRLSTELGVIFTIPPEEWVTGRPHATVVMAAFCHPHPSGGRFNDASRGAWYAGLSLGTALAESIFHRTQELAEIGVTDARVEMRQYLADFDADFHDVRRGPEFAALYDPDRYAPGQALARELLAQGSNGVIYRSVRDAGGQCLACFRPPLVLNVRPAAHFEFRWHGGPVPTVRELTAMGRGDETAGM